MKNLLKSPLFYINIVLFTALFMIITSINVNQTRLPSIIKIAIAKVQSIAGSGTQNYLAAFSGTNNIGNSIIYDNGSQIGINTTSPGATLDVNGMMFARSGGTEGLLNYDGYGGYFYGRYGGSFAENASGYYLYGGTGRFSAYGNGDAYFSGDAYFGGDVCSGRAGKCMSDLSGGHFFYVNYRGGSACMVANVFTGNCSCPNGEYGTVYAGAGCSSGGNEPCTWHFCK